MEPLTPYIERYYAAWLSYARYLCARYRIHDEACDVIGDVMEDLCRKPAAILDDLLQHEKRGDKKLKNYVRRMILFTCVDVVRRRHATVQINEKFIVHNPDTEDESLPVADEIRVVEAEWREDSFIEPETVQVLRPIKGSVYRYRNGKTMGYKAVIYQHPKRIQRGFTTRHAAFQYLIAMS